MSDPTNTTTVPATVASESWTEAAWAELQVWEQDAVAALHEAGLIFSADVWPFVKAGLSQLFSVAGKAALDAEIAAIPAELSGNVTVAAAAVGAAISGAVAANAGAIAKDAAAKADAAVDADPNSTAVDKAAVDAASAFVGNKPE